MLIRIACLLLPLLGAPALAAMYAGTVTTVRDGDTVQVTTDQGTKLEVRLSAIDASEKEAKGRPRQPFAEQSRDTLSRLTLHKRVTVDSTKRDRYDRSVGVLTVETGGGNVDAGLMQIQLGMAWAYPQYLADLSDAQRESYRYAERIARLKQRGLWADPKAKAPWMWRPAFRAQQ